MQRFVIGILLLLMLLSSKSLAAETTTYGAVVNGMSCSQISTGSLECNYKIGKDLVINIAGIGDNDAGGKPWGQFSPFTLLDSLN